MAYFCSWSGGKDSCLALHRAVVANGPPAALVNMLSEDANHSRSHGIPRHLLQGQADSIGVPLHFGVTTWPEYEATFISALRELASQGIHTGVFGDLDQDVHREWEETVCRAAGMTATLPLWHEEHEALAQEFTGAGFRAIIVTLNADLMPESFLGREYDAATLSELRAAGVDVAGEGGEFHTFVYDGPLFRAPIGYRVVTTHVRENYCILELG